MSTQFHDDRTLAGDASLLSEPRLQVQLTATDASAGDFPAGQAWLETAAGRRIPIQSSCALGRSPSSQVVLLGEKVSRHHATIQARGESEFWLADLGSTNGTWLNGRRIAKPTRLFDHDHIAVGRHRLIFRQPTGPARPNAARPVAVEHGWLLLLHLDSGIPIEQNFTPDRTALAAGSWLDSCREIIEEHFETIHRYLNDGLLAYWRDDDLSPQALAEALAKLKKLRLLSQAPFRIILHFGEITMSQDARGGDKPLTGPAVNILFRLAKLAASLEALSLASETAQSLLGSYLSFTRVDQRAVEEKLHLYQF
ncbi:MAG: FHA domain-containing protein [Verrucomicrobia bacterium]|nr:FHA domain-containing protein [Verrucomicrobiota bacterium]